MNKKIQKFLSNNNLIAEGYSLKDGIHLNQFGHELYFDFTSKVMEDLIKKSLNGL